jgi:hypothetical protein
MEHELTPRINKLMRRMDELKAAGKDLERGGEYSRVLADLRELTARRVAETLVVHAPRVHPSVRE